MKNYQLILLTTLLFVTLFYGETMGLNFGILGVAYAVLTFFKTPKRYKTNTFLFLFVAGVLSCFAFAWYGDFASFLAVFTSLFLLSFKSQNRELKSIFVIPVFALNFITFIYRFFQFEEWLPKRNASGSLQKMISLVLIPSILIAVFFGVYSLGSDHFSKIFTDFEFNFNFWEFFALSCLGFFIAFNFWNVKIYNFILGWNHHLKNDFLNEDKIQKPTFSFMDIDAERNSGVVSFLALNILLIIFIVTFNYEQFVEIPKTINQLSAEIHDRVNVVIFSIIMAIAVIMFYFKGNFSFDQKSETLKALAKVWVYLNAILVISAFAKNTEFIMNYGLTYKKLGVYAFLSLSLIGLVFTFLKIKNQKTNAYLFNNMAWYFYGIILICSFINWGGIITAHNMKRNDFALNFHKTSIAFSEKQLLKYVEIKKDKELKEEILNKLQSENEKPFLSKILYYEMIK